MQIISFGNFYIGLDDDNYCDIDIHLGRLTIQYSCPNQPNHGNENGREDGETTRSIPKPP